ncbi:Transcription factor LHW [Platanthera guangdongensis]|uniref:Transcription factor LHW n=1 Tax=Platanthera guangdongensis TaxID=2320717 RepID=A0ABR2MG31_9ASPA
MPCAFNHAANLFYGTPGSSGSSSSYQLMNQEAALSKAQISPKYHTRAKEINSFSCMDHRLFPGMAIPGVFNMIPTTSHSSFSDFDSFHLLSENSMLSHSKGGSRAMADHGNLSSSRCSSLTQDFTEFLLTSPQDRNQEPANHHILDKSMNNQIHSVDKSKDWIESTSVVHNDQFDDMELDHNPMILRQECWDDILLPVMGTSDCLSAFAMDSIPGSNKEFFTDSSSLEQLLDAVVNGDANLSSSCNSAGSQDSKNHISTTTELSNAQMECGFVSSPAVSLAELNIENMMQGSSKEGHTLWIDDSCINADGSALNPPKQDEESAKVIRKRARPGESTRPKPKDRQQIQDRVKELREIVPNSAKCSIDALLDRTIKHMLFLQSVTKYADKVNHVDEPELIGEESGVVLKDNTNGGVGGATWAYEVAGQTMVCPILVEDVHPSGQMIVEMLCEERGFFLEIADVVRGFGLTILKGVMEIRERKLWSRFLVEANRDVTRMDIFLSLIQLLHQASSFRAAESHSGAPTTGITSPAAYKQQYCAPVSIGPGDRMI